MCRQVLESFLDARRAWVISALERALEKGPLSVQELSHNLAKVSAQVQVFSHTDPLINPRASSFLPGYFFQTILLITLHKSLAGTDFFFLQLLF